MNNNDDYYAILGVDQDASDAQIRSAYRTAAMRNHPDRFLLYSQKAAATRRMQALNEAYAVLRDPVARRRYDATRQRPARLNDSRDPTRSPSSPAPHSPQATTPDNAQDYTWHLGVAWGLSSIVVAICYIYWMRPHSVGAFVIGLVFALAISLMITPILLFALAMPLAFFGLAFSDSFAARGRSFQTVTTTHSIRSSAVLLDAILRIMAVVGTILILYFSVRGGWGSGVLTTIVLIIAGGAAGELAAMAIYLVRCPRVLPRTLALWSDADGVASKRAQ